MRDVKDMDQQMGYRSLEWNWPKEAMNRPIWASIVLRERFYSLYQTRRVSRAEPNKNLTKK